MGGHANNASVPPVTPPRGPPSAEQFIREIPPRPPVHTRVGLIAGKRTTIFAKKRYDRNRRFARYRLRG